MKIGWIQDNSAYEGGAEMAASMIRRSAPDNVVIIDIDSDPYADVDMYLVHNCALYDTSLIPILSKKPVVKICYDVWLEGDPMVRKWVFDYAAKIITVSPTMKNWMPSIRAPIVSIPCPIDLAPFEAVSNSENRSGVCWIGRLHPGKGVKEALEWSKSTGILVDFYGYGGEKERVEASACRYCGSLQYSDIPKTLAKYNSFLFLPTLPDACTRTVMEAWAAGCELIVNDMTGALWWIDNAPERLFNISDQYWAEILKG